MSAKLSNRLRTSVCGLALTLLGASGSVQAGASTGYLFDLTQAEIFGLMDQYVGRGAYDPGRILARMSAPLDCRHHEALCADVGRDYAYLVLQQMWAQAGKGVRVEQIRADGVALAEQLSDRYVEIKYPDGIDAKDPYFGVQATAAGVDCTATVVNEDLGNFRLRQSARAVDGGVASLQWARAELNKKNSNGKYRAEKADKIQVDADFFVTGAITGAKVPASKVKTNEKRVTVFFPGVDINGILSNFHTEGCGTVTGPVFLQACACTGPRPAAYQGL